MTAPSPPAPGKDREEAGPPQIAIVESTIDPQAVVDAVSGPDAGAIATFLGTVRETTSGRRVLFLEYEAYVPMALTALRDIAEALPRELGPCRVAITHRIGRLEIGDVSVAIAVASPHRRVALAACAQAIERLKTTVPIWKKEHFEGGSVWIEGDPGRP